MTESRRLIVGIFLVALTMLYFEILSVRTMSFVLGAGYVYFVIGLALLGLGSAASLMSLVKAEALIARRDSLLYYSCWILVFFLGLNLVATVAIKDAINLAIQATGEGGGLVSIVKSIMSGRLYSALFLGLVMGLPYFVFGFIITLIFKTSPNAFFSRLYFADLVGGAIGCILAVVAMEILDFRVTVLIPLALSLIAAAVFRGGTPREPSNAIALVGSAMIMMLGLSPLSEHIEPRPQLNELAVDYDMTHDVSELWHDWNSFSRVGALRREAADGTLMHFMALGNGEGRAGLIPYKPEGYPGWVQRSATLGMALGTPEEALVIFAGTGADMLALDYYSRGEAAITGVELNHTMIEGALKLEDFNLRQFYQRDNIDLQVDEARAFLERTDKKYDVIILSWSGATTSYYAGSIGHTTQFVYTTEALESILGHLKDDGMVIYWNTNKINTLIGLRSIMEQRGSGDPAKAAVVLYKPGNDTSRWDRGWDSNPLVIKPAGLSAADVEMIAAAGRRLGMELAYSPYEEDPAYYWPYRQVLTASDLDEAIAELQDRTGLRFSLVSDDRPFSLDLFLTKRYFSPDFWLGFDAEDLEGAADNYRYLQLQFCAVMLVGAMVLILGPLMFRAGPPRNQATLAHLVYFAALGMGFMFIEIALMQRLSILFGNPGLSIGVVLATIILLTGVGSLISARTFALGLTIRACVLFIIGYFGLYIMLSPALVSAIIAWPLAAKVVVVTLLVAPPALAMGHLFPQGLARVQQENETYVAWAWAINGVTSTVAAGLSPLIAQVSGFSYLILLGMGCYGMILLLRPYRV